jgi:hypothetical protein
MPRIAFQVVVSVMVAADFLFPKHCSASPFQFEQTGSLITARVNHTATLLSDGKVLVAGGSGFGVQGTTELYDPASGTWTLTGSLAAQRELHSATLLHNGKVLVAGHQL